MTGSDSLVALTSLLRQSPAVTGKSASEPLQSPLPVTDEGWEQLIALAAAQKVGPALASALLAHPSASFPPAAAARLRSIQMAATQRSLLQFGELLRVQAHLRAEGIPMLFFKGQMLAQQAYGNLGLRSCFDLDLFVHQSDVLRVKAALAGLGYRPEFSFLPHHEADLLRTECEYTFIRQDGQVRIDLQWRPRARYFSFPVSSSALWSRAQRVSLQGQEVDTFALDDLVLLLVAHGAKHTWHRLEQVCALAALIHRNPALDWPGIEQAAREAGAARMLRVAVQLVVTHFAAPIPADLAARAAADPEATALATEFASRWTAEPQPLSLWETLRFHLRMRERLQDRLRHCFWLAITPTSEDWLRQPFPARLHWLHYFLRPWRLVRKYAFTGRRAA
jgi:hypothetical protein